MRHHAALEKTRLIKYTLLRDRVGFVGFSV